MIRKKNLIKNIRIDRVCLFPLEILEINPIHTIHNNEDDGVLSWIYLVEGNLSLESPVTATTTTFDTTNKLTDVRIFSEGSVKILAGNIGCALLLIFATDVNCSIYNLKHTSIITESTQSYIVPLIDNLEFLNSDKVIKIQSIINLSKDKSIEFKKINNDLDHVMIINNK